VPYQSVPPTTAVLNASAAMIFHFFEGSASEPGALVSAWCADDAGELSVASMEQARTDEQGRFDVAIAADRALRVYAFHKSHGEAAEQGWSLLLEAFDQVLGAPA
jgi:hypothetical protein